MIQRTVKVKSTTFLESKDKKSQFLQAVLVREDGTEDKQLVFDPPLQKIIQDAEKNNTSLSIEIEKEGQFWNLKTAVVASQPEKPPETQRQPRSSDQNVSIEKQVKLKMASELYRHCAEGGTPLNDELFLNCYRICAQAFRNDGDLIDEIKKIGGVEK